MHTADIHIVPGVPSLLGIIHDECSPFILFRGVGTTPVDMDMVSYFGRLGYLPQDHDSISLPEKNKKKKQFFLLIQIHPKSHGIPYPLVN